MFLIEYADGIFCNGEKLEWLSMLPDGEIKFGCNEQDLNTVDEKYNAQFINNLQVINKNSNIQKRYIEIMREG